MLSQSHVSVELVVQLWITLLRYHQNISCRHFLGQIIFFLCSDFCIDLCEKKLRSYFTLLLGLPYLLTTDTIYTLMNILCIHPLATISITCIFVYGYHWGHRMALFDILLRQTLVPLFSSQISFMCKKTSNTRFETDFVDKRG